MRCDFVHSVSQSQFCVCMCNSWAQSATQVESHGETLLPSMLSTPIYHRCGAPLETHDQEVVLRANLADAVLGVWPILTTFVATVGKADSQTFVVRNSVDVIVPEW